MERPSLAVIIPAYCEEGTIGQVVRAARRYADVIVIDDCSHDGTGERAVEAGAVVVRNGRNEGYDRTLAAGFVAATDRGYTHVVTLDADGEHHPALIDAFRQALLDREVKLVLGVRPRKQRLAETVMGWLVKTRFGAHDILCGMKGYDLDLCRANGGFDHRESIGTELAINAMRAGIPFEEIAVTGTRRADAPRFGPSLRANLRIARALTRTLAARSHWQATPAAR